MEASAGSEKSAGWLRSLTWLTRLLRGPWSGPAVIAIAIVLALPALFSPLIADDNVHAIKWQAWSTGAAEPGSGHILNDYFRFVPGDPASYRRSLERGIGTWWTAPDLRLAFWRPLSAASHLLDHRLWPGSAPLMHLHTLLWFAGLLVALQALYRRFLSPGVATLALALYAWDDAHGMVLSWVANRSAFIAGVFGSCALIAHDKWRRDGWRMGAWLAPLLFACSLLSAEMGISTTGFLLGHALFLDRGSLARRLARLGPYLVVVAVWQGFYSWGGYGIEGSGFYFHPLHDPLSYAAHLLERVPMLTLAQLTPIPADAWFLFPAALKVVVWLLAIAVLGVVARVAWPRLPAEPQSRYWLVGAAVSLAPIAVTFPSDRNLVFVGVGVAPVLALLLAGVVDNPPAGRWPRFVVAALALFNLALAPLALPAKCLSTLGMDRMFAKADGSLPRDAAATRKTLVVVRVDSEGWLAFNWARRTAHGIPKPRRARVLGLTLGDAKVTRLDEFTLRLRADQGFLDAEAHRLTRGPSRPFHVGDVVELVRMTATVTETTADDRPLTVDFRFGAPLESPEWLWKRGEGPGLVDWTPPRVGESIVVRGAGQ